MLDAVGQPDVQVVDLWKALQQCKEEARIVMTFLTATVVAAIFDISRAMCACL